ncbi:MAG: sigma-70 family RNA polymerase sigma factor [Cytophagia bacterium]|nr:sigma-70 family RNA polymerase sigma factor [Cytophagia bacterium]
MPYFDEPLVSELRKKSNVALQQLYKAHYPMVLNLVLSNNGTEQEAKDIYQEAIIHFYGRLQQTEFVLTCKIRTYLYAVSRKLWLRRLVARKKELRIETGETFVSIDEEIAEFDSKEKEFKAMEASLGQLGEPCKTILEDFYLRNQTMEEITNKFGYTNTDNAKNQKYKCLQRLKRIFFEKRSKQL